MAASLKDGIESKSAAGLTVAFLRGSFSGAVSSICLQPLDVLKTRIQGVDVIHHPHERVGVVGVRAAVRDIIAQDGILGFWRGISPSLVRASLGPGLYFLLLDTIQGDVPASAKSKQQIFLEGGAARATAGWLMGPLSVIKTRFEWDRGSARNQGILKTLMQIAREERLPGLFRGAIPTFVRDVPSSGLYLLLYQGIFKPWLGDNASQYLSQTWINLSSSVAAGVISSVLTHPADVLRTHVQLNRIGVREGISTLYEARGIRGFFSGVTTRTIRRPATMAITWTVYEFIKDFT